MHGAPSRMHTPDETRMDHGVLCLGPLSRRSTEAPEGGGSQRGPPWAGCVVATRLMHKMPVHVDVVCAVSSCRR